MKILSYTDYVAQQKNILKYGVNILILEFKLSFSEGKFICVLES